MECSGKKRTFVKTAMDAYEFPKLMPTMEGTAETSIGASAVPLGMIPLGAIVYGVSKDQGMGNSFDQNPCTWQKKSTACELAIFATLFYQITTSVDRLYIMCITWLSFCSNELKFCA
jgi:hypothetical protein